MADLTINALHKANIIDPTAGATLNSGYTATSGDPAVATVGKSSGGWYVTGVAGGQTSITVTRSLDGASVAHTLEVVAAAPFDWTLGPESPA